ncbi:hypothetical protein [Parafrankia sp. FMc2]|uniref:hypothetical protein n=1 Tax=Parafrankia sp. FMc2 TaxID=3233196 RepID=UPI0034D7AEDD
MKDRLTAGWLRSLVILGTVLFTAVGWCGFVSWSSSSNDAVTAKPGAEVFLDYFYSNPYCLVDPACVNPLATAADGVNGGFARSEFTGGRTIGRLAWIPNYFIFLALLVSVAAVVAWRSRVGSSVRTLLMTILISWNLLEHLRWFMFVAASPHSLIQEVAVTLAFLVLALISTGMIIGIARLVAPKRHSGSGNKAQRV